MLGYADSIAAPDNAFELTLGTGYTHGFGAMHGAPGLPTIATNGLTLDLGAAYRLNPRWAFGATGQLQDLTPQESLSTRGLTLGVDATYHIAPYHEVDPWISLGTGYRALWQTLQGAPAFSTQGLQLGKLIAGVDFRLTEGTMIAPVVGADMSLFLWQYDGSPTALKDPALSTFFFAGIQGRLDFGSFHDRGAPKSTASR
jgi:hypothetical protein